MCSSKLVENIVIAVHTVLADNSAFIAQRIYCKCENTCSPNRVIRLLCQRRIATQQKGERERILKPKKSFSLSIRACKDRHGWPQPPSHHKGTTGTVPLMPPPVLGRIPFFAQGKNIFVVYIAPAS